MEGVTMRTRLWLVLFVVLLLAVGCVPVPQSPQSPAPVPPDTAPTAVETAEVRPAVESTAPATVTPEPNAADGWQTYTNTQAGFSIRYPPDWTVTPSSPSTPEPDIHVDVLEGPEGRIELDWGQGFGGACYAYSALHLAQGQIPACHYVTPDGIQNWSLTAVKLPTVGVAGFAVTVDAEPAGADVVLAILATLTFEAPENLGTAAPTASPGEIVVDNAAASFWPVGNWYYFTTGQQYGKDCYVALPGLDSAAEVRPDLPEVGSYEVFAWWCGDPDHNQTADGIIEIHRSAADLAPQAVGVNYQANTGSWQSLGIYNLEPGAFLNVKSVLDGNVAADAFRFVRRSPAGSEAPPTVAPTPTMVVSHNPPAPWQQLSSGDLARRLYLTGPDLYASVPMTATHVTFDDCEAFPRDGCGGTQDGWQAIVGYETITLTYRISDDYKLVAVDGADMSLNPWLMGQDHPQRVFLRGSDEGGFSVHYDPDNTWHLLRPGDGSTPDSDVLLTREQVDVLSTLAPEYSSLYLRTTSGGELDFYGLGPVVAPSDEDLDTLLTLGAALAAAPR
jgi:hypothetical protein